MLSPEKIFPKNYSRIVKKANYINSIQNNSVKIDSDIDLKNYFLENTENSKIEVVGASLAGGGMVTVTPYTVPMKIDPNLSELKIILVALVPVYSQLYTLFVTYRLLAKANIDAHIGKGNKVVFTHKLPREVDIYVVQPRAFLDMFPGPENVTRRFATILHEIGHWHSINPYAVNAVIGLFEIIAIFLIFANASNKTIDISHILPIEYTFNAFFIVLIGSAMIMSYINSVNEQNADKFVKKLGYGQQLAEVLYIFGKSTMIGVNTLPDPSQVSKIVLSFSDRMVDFFSRIFSGYPSLLNRIRMLKEGLYIPNYNDLLLELEFEDTNKKPSMVELSQLESILIDFGKSIDSLISVRV